MTTPDEEARLEAARTEGRKKLQAGIYCRMSLAVMGDKTKVEDQERICRELSEQLGWEVADVYCDNSRSAWQKNKRRPQWERMLRDVESGRIAAIVNYHGDRLVRQPRDLEKLIDLAEGKGIRLASPTGTRNLDARDDRVMSRVIAAFAEDESAAISERRKMQYERWRREGRVFSGGPGGRRYGFESDGVTQVLAECELLREMARRILGGEARGAVARDLNARGHRTQAGKGFTANSLGRLLSRARYAGLMPDGETRAAWEPVLDRETWERLCLVLAVQAGSNPAPTNARRWLLSGIAECGAEGCGEPLSIAQSGRTRARKALNTYGCKRKGCGRVRRNAAHLDAYVSARTVHLLNDPRQPEGELPVPPDHAPEWAALTRERGETERLARDYAASPGRLRLLMARLDQIDARMAELREREAGDARSRLLGRYRGITRAEFDGLPLEVRRALVAASYRVVVLPASGRGPGFRTEDVRLEPL